MPAGPDDASLVFAIRAGRAASAPACLSRRAVVCGFGALALTGCSSAPPPGGPVAAAGAQTQSPLMSLFAGPKVTSVSGQLVAAAGLNPSISGRPSPLTVRLYELSSLTAFDNADFISLYQGDKATLAAEMLARDDIVLAPGETRPYARNLNPETRYLAVLAAYRDIERAQWRSSAPIQIGKAQKLVLRADALKISLAVQP